MSEAIISVAGIIVVLSGVYLVGMALSVMVARRRVERFLESFASSARSHYLEQALRLTAGLGFVVFSPQMKFQTPFQVYGWILIVTTVALLLVPWRWHRRFGEWAIPFAIAHIKIYAIGALGLGAFVLFAALSR